MSGDQHLEISAVCALVNKKRWTIYRWIRSLEFPAPINPETYPRKWLRSAVVAWCVAHGVVVE